MSEAYQMAQSIIFRPSEGIYALGLDINKASVVALGSAGLLTPDQASTIARGVKQLDAVEYQGAWVDYLEFEHELEKLVGSEASLIHLGRSRQDIFSTVCQWLLRTAVLDVLEALLEARRRLLVLAERHRDMVIPAYTHGVQAQPTTFGHYLLALESALARASARLEDSYGRVNRSPLGAGALTTSRFELDRGLLAELLGFDGLIENSYDANHVSPTDAGLEVASTFTIVATQISQFSQDFHLVHANPQPWLRLGDGPLTGISSMMPQKRNPSGLETLRELAALVIGRMSSLLIAGHNLHTGMPDLREESITALPGLETTVLVKLFGDVVDSLELDADRALAECLHDYSTMTEVADVLYQVAGVPFRTGHRFASALADHGRETGKYPADIDFDTASGIYRKLTSEILPLSPEQYRLALDPAEFVRTRGGIGGPQPRELARMLAEQRGRLEFDGGWFLERSKRVVSARELLEQHFSELAHAPRQAGRTMDAQGSRLHA